jgi:hypothetical protein
LDSKSKFRACMVESYKPCRSSVKETFDHGASKKDASAKFSRHHVPRELYHVSVFRKWNALPRRKIFKITESQKLSCFSVFVFSEAVLVLVLAGLVS